MKMFILFVHGWNSVPGGVKPTYLKNHGHEVINPALPDEDFDEAERIAQAEFDKHRPHVIVGSRRGGAVAMNMKSGDAKLVLLCPAWKKYGTASTVKPGTVVLHSRADDVVPFADSEELARSSGAKLIEVGTDHRLADPESLEMMLKECIKASVPEWTDDEDELLQRDWTGLCYTAAKRWAMVANADWIVIHGSVVSQGKRIDHAWCELGDVVVDLTRPVGARITERNHYYRLVKPEVHKAYSTDDALIAALRNGHDGPWD